MTLHHAEFPILEYDTNPRAVIQPGEQKRYEGLKLPELCLMSFFGEAVEGLAERTGAKVLGAYQSETRKFPFYSAEFEGREVCFFQAAVGAPMAAAQLELVIGHGVKKIIACGGCGVLEPIPQGDAILPVAALRDEGVSYHYLPPAREVELDECALRAIRETLHEHGTPYIETKAWTTDALFRETPEVITRRREEGCAVVEMECAALAAVARFRGACFGQLLFSGDILTDFEHYDDRLWMHDLSGREKIYYLALKALLRLDREG